MSSAGDVDPSHEAPRLEEQVLAECQELVKEGGANNQDGGEGEDFSSTDALLEQIAETITSIEKAQNLRASQVTATLHFISTDQRLASNDRLKL